MAHSRPSARLVALLVYALVVNAVVWATGVAARPAMSGSLICHSVADARGTPIAPAKSEWHACCDLACAGSAAIAMPDALGLVPKNETATAIRRPAQYLALINAYVRPWPTGPPAH